MPRIEATVVPNSREFSAALDPKTGRIKVRVTERAERGRANAELVKGLSRLLSCDVAIVSGLASKRKVLQVSIDEAEVRKRIAAAGP
jgi:uncharacterized protein (TIGR00251 family)